MVANDQPIQTPVIASYLASQGYAAWVQAESRARVEFPADLNFGISGDSTTEMLARVGTVTASDAGVVVVLGGTNDADSSVTLETMIANMQAIVQALVDAGKLVILIAELPRGDPTFTPSQALSAANQTKFEAYRQWMLDDVPSLFPGRVIIADVWPLWVIRGSTAGYVQPGLTYDGLHPSPAGARLIARVLNAIFAALFPAREWLLPVPDDAPSYYPDWPVYTWLNLNPLLTESGGTQGSGFDPPAAPSSSAVPTNWQTVRNSNAASGELRCAVSFEDDSDGLGRWFRMDVYGQSRSTIWNGGNSYQYLNPEIQFRTRAVDGSTAVAFPITGINPGDRLVAFAEVEIMAGSYGLTGFTLRLIQTRTGSPSTYECRSLTDRGPADPIPPFAQSNRQLHMTTPLVIQSGLTGLSVSGTIQVSEGKRSNPEGSRPTDDPETGFLAFGVRASVRIRRIGVRKIPTT